MSVLTICFLRALTSSSILSTTDIISLSVIYFCFSLNLSYSLRGMVTVLCSFSNVLSSSCISRNHAIKELIKEGPVPRDVRMRSIKQEVNEFIVQMAQDRHI